MSGTGKAKLIISLTNYAWQRWINPEMQIHFTLSPFELATNSVLSRAHKTWSTDESPGLRLLQNKFVRCGLQTCVGSLKNGRNLEPWPCPSRRPCCDVQLLKRSEVILPVKVIEAEQTDQSRRGRRICYPPKSHQVHQKTGSLFPGHRPHPRLGWGCIRQFLGSAFASNYLSWRSQSPPLWHCFLHTRVHWLRSWCELCLEFCLDSHLRKQLPESVILHELS